jgi:AraC family transcriptional regulator
MTPPSTRTLDASSEAARALWRAANEDLFHEGPFEQSELRSDFATELSGGCERFARTVQISPSELVKRRSTERYGIVAESIYAPVRTRIEIRYDAPVHLLVLYEDGVRREGESSIDGLPPSALRNLANKMTFVPAGHAHREWHETSAPLRVTYLYLNPAKLQKSIDTNATYAPRTFFEDSILWGTASKLKSVIESDQPESMVYFDALANVLAHELSRSSQEVARPVPASRGGLAGWQKRVVTTYIEDHLEERLPLVTLAQLARLSECHFCRAFKKSVGTPPHQYHLQRRIERAKQLLSDRANSITDVAIILGYSFTSSFTLSFRKITGQTPTEFRRKFT